jgi:hypothetical protein
MIGLAGAPVRSSTVSVATCTLLILLEASPLPQSQMYLLAGPSWRRRTHVC